LAFKKTAQEVQTTTLAVKIARNALCRLWHKFRSGQIDRN
jgi:hypothetical protein